MSGLTDPIEVLMKEHESGLECVRRLENAAIRIEEHGFAYEAFTAIAESIRCIDREIRAHSEREEMYLFPLVEQYVNGSARSLRREHRELWRAFRALIDSVNDVENGRIHATTMRELVGSSKLLAKLLQDHFTRENDVLFPMAKELLTPEEYRELGQAIHKSTNGHSEP